MLWVGFLQVSRFILCRSLCDREVVCSASDRQGSNFEFFVSRAASSHTSHHTQEVLMAQFLPTYVQRWPITPFIAFGSRLFLVSPLFFEIFLASFFSPTPSSQHPWNFSGISLFQKLDHLAIKTILLSQRWWNMTHHFYHFIRCYKDTLFDIYLWHFVVYLGIK